MRMSNRILCLIVVLFGAVLCVQAQDAQSPPPPPKYRMEVVYISDVASHEYVFVVGKIGFKSVDALKKFLSDLPVGSSLEWAPGCVRWGDEPLLSSEQDMEDFKAFCLARNINFILVPSG